MLFRTILPTWFQVVVVVVWVAVATTTSTTTITVSAAPLGDLIEELPLYGRPPTPQFSGYLDASEGCDVDTNGPICKLHYWLALADSSSSSSSSSRSSSSDDVANKPVVLWLNGGPGSSSILGYLQEVGPLLMNATGGLMDNPWAWTRLVNLLILEAPMGVGFSYCSKQLEGGVCHNTDRYTASASRAALVDFFTNKFPEFQQTDFYITGESYAGVYIPTLAKEILDNSPLQNLKGIAVGDPCTDNDAQADSMDPLWYANKYGLVDEEVYNVLWKSCSDELLSAKDPRHRFRQREKEQQVVDTSLRSSSRLPPPTPPRPAAAAAGGGAGVGKHAHWALAATLNAELYPIEDLKARRVKARELYHERVLGVTMHTSSEKGWSDECTLAYRKFMLSSSNSLSQGWKDLFIDDYSLFAPVSDVEDKHMAKYMNRKDVIQALHVQETPIETWPYPQAGFDYTKEYNACNWGDDILFPNISMVDIYQHIVPQLTRTWIYNGDTDPCVSYEGTREAVKQILQPELDGGGYRPWFYNQTGAPITIFKEKAIMFGPNLVAQDLGPQFGGEVVNYELGLAFVTFHGSGTSHKYHPSSLYSVCNVRYSTIFLGGARSHAFFAFVVVAVGVALIDFSRSHG
jgi:hypothetical protein